MDLCGFGGNLQHHGSGLDWEAAYATSFQIQVSSNAVNWTPIYSTTTGPGGIQDLTGLSGTGRYVRMYGTVRATTVWLFTLGISSLWNSCANQSATRAGGDSRPNHSGWQDTAGHKFSQRSECSASAIDFQFAQSASGRLHNSNTGLFTWRPTIAQSPSTQTIAVVVSDNEVPPLTASQKL